MIPPGGCWHIPGVLGPQVLPVVGVEALTALPELAPRQTIDQNMGTRWVAHGAWQWIQYDLGTVQTLTGVEIAWYQGHLTQTPFGLRELRGWRHLAGSLSGSEQWDHDGPLKLVGTCPVQARYVQIVGQGPALAISEVRLLGTPP